MNTQSKLLKPLKRILSRQSVASIGLYGSMSIYVLLWVFPGYQANFLIVGFVLKAITIPYFVRIGELPVAQEAAFLMVGDVVGISLNLGAAQLAAQQCRLLFGV